LTGGRRIRRRTLNEHAILNWNVGLCLHGAESLFRSLWLVFVVLSGKHDVKVEDGFFEMRMREKHRKDNNCLCYRSCWGDWLALQRVCQVHIPASDPWARIPFIGQVIRHRHLHRGFCSEWDDYSGWWMK
jgi:hypothetical protein